MKRESLWLEYIDSLTLAQSIDSCKLSISLLILSLFSLEGKPGHAVLLQRKVVRDLSCGDCILLRARELVPH